MSGCVKCGHDPEAVVTARWEFVVSREVKSLNSSSTNHGSRRFAYRDERKGWERDMATARLVYGIPAACGRRRVTLTRMMHGRQREFDLDGLVGGSKKIVDAMKTAGLIVGDSPVHLEIHYSQSRSETRGLMVLIEELR